MDNAEALAIVEDYRKEKGLFGTLEAMIAMKDDEFLTPKQRAGYHVAFLGFRRLLVGDDE